MSSELHDSIVVITGKTSDIFGTGFAFHKTQQATYFLTCTHVINDVGGESDLKVDQHPATVVAKDTEDGFDLAILRIEESLDIPILKLKITGEIGWSVATIGWYLYGKQKIIQPIQCILENQAKVDSKNLRNRGTCWHIKIEGDFQLQKGYSGAPLFDKQKNNVIGIINQRKGNGQKGLAISIETLKMIWPELPEEIHSTLKIDETTIPITIDSGPLMNFENELAAFQKIVTAQDCHTRLISLSGPSNMGKSRLIREYRRLANENHVEELLIDLKQQIDVERCLDSIITRFGMQNFTEYYKYLTNRESKSLSRNEEREWHKNLTRIFFTNLLSYQEPKPLIVIFDHYEKADRDFKDWLNATFLTYIFGLTPIIVVIAGQEEIQIDTSHPHQCRFQIKKVAKEYCLRYADDCKVRLSPQALEIAYEACQGNPGFFITFIQLKLHS